MFEFLIIFALVIFALGLRTFHHPLLRKAGAVAMLVATYGAGYFFTGSHWGGAVAVAGWFLLPWIEIVGRVRKLRLPLERRLEKRSPPNRERCPMLEDWTKEIEERGYEWVEDAGWQWGELDQFIRIFYNGERRTQACITHNEQGGIAFAFLSLTSRAKGGGTFTTWTNPFANSLRTPPGIHVLRRPDATSIDGIAGDHEAFLADHEVAEALEPMDGEALRERIQFEMRRQVEHNLDAGFIRLAGDGTFRYSWRGCFHMWWQVVKDMVRFA